MHLIAALPLIGHRAGMLWLDGEQCCPAAPVLLGPRVHTVHHPALVNGALLKAPGALISTPRLRAGAPASNFQCRQTRSSAVHCQAAQGSHVVGQLLLLRVRVLVYPAADDSLSTVGCGIFTFTKADAPTSPHSSLGVL